LSQTATTKRDSVELTLLLPLRMQKQPWPVDEEHFVQIVFERVDKLLNGGGGCRPQGSKQQQPPPQRHSPHRTEPDGRKPSIKRYGLMAYCRMQRKLDFVDSVLYREMLLDEHRWTHYGPEMAEIK